MDYGALVEFLARNWSTSATGQHGARVEDVVRPHHVTEIEPFKP